MRKSVIAANWKMYKTRSETEGYARNLLTMLDKANDAELEIIICPPFTDLQTLASVLQGSSIKIGAQNLFWETSGAYTGEISAPMLVDSGCSYVIIGHSERRHILNESDRNINRKIKAALDGSLIPILCVGETLQERQNNLARQVVKGQMEKALSEIELLPGELVVAYEPVWAIGTGINASPDDAQEMTAFIRELLVHRYDQEMAASTAILYGGSVKAANIADFVAKSDIDGALVGSASLEPHEFAEIVRSVNNV